MNYEFFDAMFGESVKKLGSSAFYSKYQFMTGNKMREQISQFISRCAIEYKEM
jgi:hypothetical protein